MKVSHFECDLDQVCICCENCEMFERIHCIKCKIPHAYLTLFQLKNISHATKISRRGLEFGLASLKHITVAAELWETQHVKRSYFIYIAVLLY